MIIKLIPIDASFPPKRGEAVNFQGQFWEVQKVIKTLKFKNVVNKYRYLVSCKLI